MKAEEVKTDLGNFVRVKCGVDCYRNPDGTPTGKIVDLYREIPEKAYDPERGLTTGEKNAANYAADYIFAKLLEENGGMADYIRRFGGKRSRK